MQYLIATKRAFAKLPACSRVVADGECVSMEQPWSFGDPMLVRLPDDTDPAALKPLASGGTAFTVEGTLEPGAGEVIVIAAHIMRDADGFRPYAAGVPGVIKDFGCRYLARGGTVTPVAGAFVPTRVVLMEFPKAADLMNFYFSDAYAPLLKIRHATTEPRFVLVARSGGLPPGTRGAITERLRQR